MGEQEERKRARSFKRDKGGYMPKTDKITIEITGSRKIRQIVVNKVHALCFDEDLLEEVGHPEAQLRFDSTLDPNEEEME